MGFRFSKRSVDNMNGVHPDLIRVAYTALRHTKYDFGINESSVRTIEEQRDSVESGKSKTMNSRHVKGNNACGLSCAIDFNVYVNGKTTWDIKYFRKVMQAFVTAAIEEGVYIELGGLWENFIDGPHIELSRKVYA